MRVGVVFLVLMMILARAKTGSFPLAFGESPDGAGFRFVVVAVVVETITVAVTCRTVYKSHLESRDISTYAFDTLLRRMWLDRAYATKKAIRAGERSNRSGKGARMSSVKSSRGGVDRQPQSSRACQQSIALSPPSTQRL